MSNEELTMSSFCSLRLRFRHQASRAQDSHVPLKVTGYSKTHKGISICRSPRAVDYVSDMSIRQAVLCPGLYYPIESHATWSWLQWISSSRYHATL